MERLIAKLKCLDRKKLIITSLVAIFFIYKLVFVGGLGFFDRGNPISDDLGASAGTNTRGNDRFLSNKRGSYSGSDSNGQDNSGNIVSLDGGQDKAKNKNGKIVVYISGAVSSPGVISIGADKRLDDAIKMVGGLAKDADINRINLAMNLEDSQHYIIPYKGQDVQADQPQGGGQSVNASGHAGQGQSQGQANDQSKVNINTADEKSLEAIPGVGPATAKKIVDYRTKQGKFNAIEDIKNVSGIGDKKFESMKDFISVK